MAAIEIQWPYFHPLTTHFSEVSCSTHQGQNAPVMCLRVLLLSKLKKKRQYLNIKKKTILFIIIIFFIHC